MVGFVRIDASQASLDCDLSAFVGSGRWDQITEEADDGNSIADKADGIHH
jgi:hypothetical protein